jgi:hypothetical protein
MTSSRAFHPGRLWRELRPVHPVLPGRLIAFGGTWLVLMHLGAGLLAVLSVESGRAFGPSLPVLAVPGSGRGWSDGLGSELLWPYRRWITVPTSPNTAITNTIAEFVIMAAAPMMVMGVLAWLCYARAAPGAAVHVLRACVLSMPVAAAWVMLGALLFVGAAVAGEWYHREVLAEGFWLGSIAGLFATVVWWWRQFVVDYLGARRHQWALMVLGVVSFVAGGLVFVAASRLTDGFR